MKQLRITVNGKSYDVSVEELGSSAAPVAAPVAAPAPAPAPAPEPSAEEKLLAEIRDLLKEKK